MKFPTRKLLTVSLWFAATLLSGANLGYVYPAGARAGTTVRVIIGGQGLGRHTRLLISGPGVELVKFQYAPGVNYNPGSGEQAVWARTYMKQVYNGGHRQPLRDNRNFGVWRYHEFMERMDQLDPLMLSLTCRALFGPRTSSLQASPAIAQRAVLTLRIAPDAPPGCREFRLATPSGRPAIQLTNPVRFYVGNVPEFREQYYQLPPRKAQPVLFTIPSAVNGQIEPGEIDRFKFELAKGETVHFALKGRILNPYIGDGVPGNFQPVLEVRDETGKSLAFADDNYFDPDPVLDFTAPADGLYTLEIRDALYRGRADFVYRIDAGLGPWKRPPLTRPGFDLP
ncbi:MAG: PPC domain-containing protein, partial [Lentisphaeria bacterium]|nr:PPC domain-containing protein [Lentisphaeria bacterium]